VSRLGGGSVEYHIENIALEVMLLSSEIACVISRMSHTVTYHGGDRPAAPRTHHSWCSIPRPPRERLGLGRCPHARGQVFSEVPKTLSSRLTGVCSGMITTVTCRWP